MKGMKIMKGEKTRNFMHFMSFMVKNTWLT